MILGAGFYVIPHKISEYLLTGFSTDANMQKIRGLCKTLNINDLCLKTVFLSCNKQYFSMQLSPYRGLKSTESGTDMDLTGS